MSIFVGNLPFRAEREDVLQLFSPYGEVLNCSLPLERDTGRKRGFAFVEMSDETIEATAIEGLQGAEMMGRQLRINKAEPRSNAPRRNNYDNSRSGNNSDGNYSGRYGGNLTNSNYGGRYGGNSSNSGYGGRYGGSTFSAENTNQNTESKISGAEGWEDRSYGQSSDDDHEISRSRRRRGTSNDANEES